jgi:glycosyltransferase involved in cell wall biosynthesis
MTVRLGLLTYGLDRPLTGIGRYTVELARALARAESSLELTLLAAGKPEALRGDGGRWAELAMPGCRLLPGLMTLGNVLIPAAARRLGLDVVHDPTGVTPLVFGAAGARIVVTVHDVFAWSYPGTSSPLDTLIYRHWLPRVLPRAETVITVSHHSKTDIIRYLGVAADKVQVIHLAISNRYRPTTTQEIAAARSRYNLPQNCILITGSVEERKNTRRLLEAYAQLRRGGEQRPLVIAGARRRKSAGVVETVSRLGLERQVIFTGYVAEADLPAVYSGADLFVFPSLYEGFGLPPLEAMACGAPVVCSNAASLPEVVGDAALLFDPQDVDGMAEAMQRVLADTALRQEMRQRGLARAQQFTWERTARETAAVYRQVLESA